MNIIKLKSEDPLIYTLDGVDIPTKEAKFLNEKGDNDSISYIEIGDRKIYTKHDSILTEKLQASTLDKVLSDIETERSEKMKDLK